MTVLILWLSLSLNIVIAKGTVTSSTKKGRRWIRPVRITEQNMFILPAVKIARSATGAHSVENRDPSNSVASFGGITERVETMSIIRMLGNAEKNDRPSGCRLEKNLVAARNMEKSNIDDIKDSAGRKCKTLSYSSANVAAIGVIEATVVK